MNQGISEYMERYEKGKYLYKRSYEDDYSVGPRNIIVLEIMEKTRIWRDGTITMPECYFTCTEVKVVDIIPIFDLGMIGKIKKIPMPIRRNLKKFHDIGEELIDTVKIGDIIDGEIFVVDNYRMVYNEIYKLGINSFHDRNGDMYGLPNMDDLTHIEQFPEKGSYTIDCPISGNSYNIKDRHLHGAQRINIPYVGNGIITYDNGVISGPIDLYCYVGDYSIEGVALNGKFNGKIIDRPSFERHCVNVIDNIIIKEDK